MDSHNLVQEYAEMSVFSRIAIGVLLVALLSSCMTNSRSGCDRQCLIAMANTYLEAIAANDPAMAHLSADVRFVENIVDLEPGQGIWETATGVSDTYRIMVPDPSQASIGLLTLVSRHGKHGVFEALLAARLKVRQGQIVEAEHLLDEVPAIADPANLQAPRANIQRIVHEDQRMSRRVLQRIALSYYDALNLSDGSLAPFAADCERMENGMITAAYHLGPALFDSIDVNDQPPPAVARDCIGQMNSRRFAYIDAIDNRRIVAVDPVQGLVMGWSHFRQSMAQGPQRMIAADGSEVLWEEKRAPYDLPAAHVFKISGGQIHEVEALGIFLPYNSRMSWE